MRLKYCININLTENNCTMVIQENIPILRKYTEIFKDNRP